LGDGMRVRMRRRVPEGIEVADNSWAELLEGI
jgi:hypothetical protein